LERAAKLSRSRVSAETLGQRLQVDVAQDADVITIRVVDSTATGAARLVDAVTLAYQEVVAKQVRERSREVVSQLRNTQSRLQTRLAEINAELAGRPNDLRLRAQRKAVANELLAIRQAIAVEATHRPSLDPDPPTVSNQPIALRPGRPMAIGMLAGLLASTALAWWLSRPSGTLTMAAAGGR